MSAERLLDRREYLKLLGAAALAAWHLPSFADGRTGALATSAQGQDGWSGGWPLWLARAGEAFYFDARTRYGYEVARYLLRDIAAGGVRGYPDGWLLRALSQMQVWWAQYGHHVRLDVTSGLRMPQTNARIEGAARASMHLPAAHGWFRAVDFRPGRVDIVRAAQWARAAGIGGIGLYLERDFLHADTGRVRHWVSR